MSKSPSASAYVLRPSRSAESYVTVDEDTFSRHVHLAGDDAFHEEALQDLAVQQILKGRGGLFLYPAADNSFLSQVRAAATTMGREKDVVVLDFLGDASTHGFEPEHSDVPRSILPELFPWLVGAVSARSVPSKTAEGWSQRLPPDSLDPMQEQCSELLASYAAALLQLRNSTQLSTLVSVLGSDNIRLALPRHAERKETRVDALPLGGMPREAQDWQRWAVARLTRVLRVCGAASKSRPVFRATVDDIRSRIVCVPVPDMLERRPGAGLGDPLTRNDIALLLALSVVAQVGSALNGLHRDEERNSFLLAAPELFRWAPKELRSFLEQARAARTAVVQYARYPLRAEEVGSTLYCIESSMYTHIGRTMDMNGRFVLVHFNNDSQNADLITEI